jgi:hypothetical protein
MSSVPRPTMISSAPDALAREARSRLLFSSLEALLDERRARAARGRGCGRGAGAAGMADDLHAGLAHADLERHLAQPDRRTATAGRARRAGSSARVEEDLDRQLLAVEADADDRPKVSVASFFLPVRQLAR